MMGFWLLYNSFIMIGLASDFDTFGVPGAGWITGGAVVLLVLSIIVLVNPFGAGIATVIVLAGSGLIVFGLLTCMLSMKLKDVHRSFESEYDR